MLTGGACCLAAGELLFAVTSQFWVALAARVLIGLGDACMFLNVLRLAASWFPPGRYVLIAALTNLVGALGQIATTLPLDLALARAGWTATFATSAVLTACLGVLGYLGVRDHPPGVAATRRPPPAERPVTSLRAALRPSGTRHGMWLHCVLMGPFLTVTALWGHPFLVEGQGLADHRASAVLIAAPVGLGGGSVLTGWLVGARPWLRLPWALSMSVLLGTSWALTLLWPGGTVPLWALVGLFLVTGVCGSACVIGFDVARAANPLHRSGAVSGLVNVGAYCLAGVLLVVIGGLLDAVDRTGPDLFRVAFAPLLVAMAYGMVRIGWMIRAERVPAQVATD